MAGAVLQRPLAAQVRDTLPKKRDTTITIPGRTGADSLLRDSLAKRDSIERERLKRDTLKAPLAHAPMAADLGIARTLHWTRDSLWATGAITVADLLERVPGVTTLHAGWISSPAVGAYLGDVRRVRVFYDGVELAPLDPRGNGALDLTQVNLWAAEEAQVEQGPEEVRVYLRSWSVRHTEPRTRTDISTGDQQTNLYRGFFGKRFHNGVALQFAAQQFGTTPPSVFGSSSDQLGIIGRVGWSRDKWSVDGFINRISRHRGSITGLEAGDAISALESSRSDSYFRVGYGDPDTSLAWAQVMAVGSKYDYTGVRTVPTTNLKTAEDSALAVASLDTSIYRPQYIAMAGTVRGPLRVSGGGRLFASGGSTVAAPIARASFTTARLALSAFAEGKSADSAARADLTAQLTPLSFVSLLGSVGRLSDKHSIDPFSATYMRGEAGLRVKNLWLLGGVIRRDSVRLAAPRVFDTLLVNQLGVSANGITAGIRGQLWRLINADVWAVRWSDTTGFYRPRYQTRSELFLRTNLLEQFPSGNFGIKAAIVHEYRSAVHFPTVDGNVRVSTGYRTFSTLLEIRILQATLSWQFRNFLGERYAQVPSFIMPRQTNFYGVRWEFFN